MPSPSKPRGGTPPRKPAAPAARKPAAAPVARKGAKPGPRSSTPLDAAQHAIAEKEAKLRAQMERYQTLIEQAPKLAEEQRRAHREQLVKRASHIDRRFGNGAALPDRRYDLNVSIPARQRRLRHERNEGRLTFFILVIVFAAVVTWLYYTVTQG